MDAAALARDNHRFYYVEVAGNCLVAEKTATLLERAVRKARSAQKHGQLLEDDGITQIPFQCSDGEFGYLRFRNDDAKAIADTGLEISSVAYRIPRNIKGELNELCEVSFGTGFTVSFVITTYEGDVGHGCTKIADPVRECPDQVPLGRVVEMRVVTK